MKNLTVLELGVIGDTQILNLDKMTGETILHYKILNKIGAGAIGVVYQARDLKLNRLVVLKFLPPELTHNAEAIDRFINEAQTASALDHANLCTIY